MRQKDPRGYYTILGITLNADAADIKAAFRRKAMELHPDRNKAAGATEHFQLLNEAYSVLGDPVSRAQYDTMSIESGPRASEQSIKEDQPEPIVCSCCGKVTAQPRYAIFYAVKSYIIETTRSTIQGIFCSACAEKKAFKASAITWVFGWWGFPWGPIYSIQALFNNLMGGKQPPNNINVKLAAHQAWVFAVQGKVDLARAIALDALALAKKIKPDQAMARMKKSFANDVADEGAELRAQIESLLEALGGNGNNVRLKYAWSLFRRPFYVQAGMAFALFGSLWYAIHTSPSSSQKGSKPYIASPSMQPAMPDRGEMQVLNIPPYIASPSMQPAVPRKPTYVRPAMAPNGHVWPVSAGYVNGYPRRHANGLSTVTVDNSNNDFDVFVKLVSLDRAEATRVRHFFIPAGGRFTLDRVTAGNYDVRYCDLNSGRLTRSESFSLEEVETYDGTRFSAVTMTLYKVRSGNMQTYDLAEDDF